MKGRERTVEQAREAVASEPKRWRAAIIYETAAPLTRDATVRLYATVKGADEDLRELWKAWQEEGFKSVMGGLGAGVIKARNGDEVRCVYLQKRSA